MPPLRHLTRADYRVMPWANGQGSTTELVRVDGPSGQMLWRLSLAQVVADGPFSVFPGVDRVLTVLTGAGFRLTGPGLDLAALPMQPLAFPGDVPVRAVGVQAPLTDFNVMTARDAMMAQVQLAATAELTAPMLCIFAPEAATLHLGEAPVRMAGHDLLIAAGPVQITADRPLLLVSLTAAAQPV